MPIHATPPQVAPAEQRDWFSTGDQHTYETINFYNNLIYDEGFGNEINKGKNPYQALLSVSLTNSLKFSPLCGLVFFIALTVGYKLTDHCSSQVGEGYVIVTPK